MAGKKRLKANKPGGEGPIEALILAGGAGTRLAERVPGRPKPLAPVGGRPFLAFQLDWLGMQPVRCATIAAHHMADQVIAFATAYDGRPLPLAVVCEEEPLGTGGAVVHALGGRKARGPVLVLNGDTYFGFDVAPALEQHRLSDAPATLFVARVPDVSRFGTVVVEDGRVTAFHQATGEVVPGMVSCGAYILDPAVLADAPEGPFSMERDFFPILARQRRLAAHVVEDADAFFDIGMPEAYDSFRARISRDANGGGLEAMCVAPHANLRGAMQAIQRTGKGICFVRDGDGLLAGVLTDGDIRRALIEGAAMDDAVESHMNRDFVSVPRSTPKEHTLKLLNTHVRAIPVIDDAGRLMDVVGTGYVPPRLGEHYARAKAPVRLSLSGGGTDFTDYFMKFGGISLTATTNRHSHAVLRRRDDGRIIIVSQDLKQKVEAASLDDLVYDGTLDLIKAGIRVMRPGFGFELQVASDVPPGSGLGGSAALLSAVIGCFNEFRNEDRLDNHAIAEHAFEAERFELTIAGGWQDQYATVFGGFNFIEFTSEANVVTPLRLATTTVQELEERLLVCYTGHPHGGGGVQESNRTRRMSDPAILKVAEEYKAIAGQMKSRLLRGALGDFGTLLDAGWRLKRRYSDGATNPEIDAIYDAAITAGAEGGRLLGTGGGGYFLFCVAPFQRFEVVAALAGMGLEVENVVFDHNGLQSWTVRP